MLPNVLPEELVHCFKFYRDQSLLNGMRYGTELYELVNQASPVDRLTIYQTICELVEQGNIAVITVSAKGYKGWISLRSSGYSQWLESHGKRPSLQQV